MNDVMTRPRGRTYRRELRVEWGDCDPAGIVFYPRYLEFFDANTAYLLEHAGLSMDRLRTEYGIAGLPLVDVQAKFLLPSRTGERITIESEVAKCSRARVTVDHRLFRGDELAVQGRESRVWAAASETGTSGLRICAVPQEVVDRLMGSSPTNA